MGDPDVTMRAVLLIAAALVGAAILSWFSGFLTRKLARGRSRRFLTRLHEECHRPWRAVLFVVALLVVLPATHLTGEALANTKHVLLLALIGTGSWLLVKVLFVAEDLAFRRLPVDMADNRRTRRARTQISLIRRMTAASITVIALAAALMTFPQLRTLGTSLFASAGIATIVVGLAAQSTLSNAFAGLQLAFTDTLRFDDVVVVEGEWGHIEELSLTHVVVRLWDNRRLILPTTYFTSKPFQNWTRHESRMLGTVTLHLDHRAPVSAIREQTRRIAEKSPLWDGDVCGAQVIDTTESTIVVRVLVSAVDGPTAWDLRCEVREGLLDFLNEHHPESLPVARHLATVSVQGHAGNQ